MVAIFFIPILLIIIGLVTLPLVFVEGIPLAIGLRIPYRRTSFMLFCANFLSLLAGLPVKYVNAMLYHALMPKPMAAYFRAYPYAAAIGSLNFFIVTLLIEYGVIASLCRKRKIPVEKKRLMLTVLVMNAMTFAIFAPLNYFVTRPHHDVKTFTDDSSWAQHPLTEICYIAPDGSFRTVMTDGSNQRAAPPDIARDFKHPEMQWWDNRYPGYRHTNECVTVTAWMDIASWISVEQGNDKWNIADNPGLLKLSSNRRFYDVHILENGQEFIFTDRHDIYLVNIPERKVGRITSGRSFITLTPRYRHQP